MKSVRLFFWGLGVGLLGIGIGTISAQAEPAPLFAPILPEIREKLPQGLQMRLPATLPERPETLYPFVKANDRGLQVYLAIDAECDRPSCSVGGASVFTQTGFASWQRKLENAEAIALPNGIQGYYLKLGEGEDADHYVIWQQDGAGYVIGTDSRNTERQELVQIAASMVSEPPIR
ncbi:hypothetical protein HC931_11520 [Candidatus Gracilibacteria bacterium]|nr:hypothetical protein [Candidatus Gracilibacteria bacterium]NJQ96971.1 hypothetical protein [Hydrococcus sp. CSU_1_8]